MNYTVVIRTLGKGGDFYQRTLDSIVSQTIQPSAILIYLAEGYPIPPETVHKEKYIYVPKGMVAQRALEYQEVETEYILFLDDDVFLPPQAVETLYHELTEHQAQVISPCVFPNHLASITSKMRLSILGREVCRLLGNKWGYKVLSNAGFSYINHPTKPVYESQTNAGPCFFCRKNDFLKIAFKEERWIEDAPYAFPEDQVMYYKMYCHGLKILTSFDSGIIHMDASTTVSNPADKTRKVIYSEYRNKLIFWHRFLFLPEKNLLHKVWKIIAITYTYGIQIIKYSLRYLLGHKEEAIAFWQGIQNGFSFIRSKKYSQLTPIKKTILRP